MFETRYPTENNDRHDREVILFLQPQYHTVYNVDVGISLNRE